MMNERKIVTYAPLVHDPEVSFEFFCEGETMVQQHLVDQTDVNEIVETYTRTGVLPPATRQGFYDDVSDLNQGYDILIEQSRETQRKLRDEQAAREAAPPSAPAESPPAVKETTGKVEEVSSSA